MDKELVREIIASGSATLSKLAEVAGSTAQHIYTVLVRQQFVDGVTTLVQLALWCFLMYFGGMKIWRWHNAGDEYSDRGLGAIIVGIGLVIVSFAVVGFLGAAVGKFINPEYYALKFLFESVRSTN